MRWSKLSGAKIDPELSTVSSRKKHIVTGAQTWVNGYASET